MEFERHLTDYVVGGLVPIPSRDEVPRARGATVTLFRQEALDAHDAVRWGRPVGLMPVGWPVILLVLLLLLGVAGAFLSTASFARKETVRGILRPQGGETRVLASEPGLLRALHVAEGMIVNRGDLLAVVGSDRITHGGAAAADQALAALLAEERTLIERLAAVGAVAPIAAESASADVAALQAERAAALRAIATGRDRRRIALERLDAGRQLMARGFLSSEEVRRREEALIAVDQSITDAQARATSLAAQIQRAEAARRRLPLDAELTRGQLQAQLASVQQRRAQIEAGRGYEIRAQTNGRVTALQVAVGQVLDNARPLMTITPEDPRLIAELYLPSRAVGFVNSGQAVRLLYDAFPYQRFGASAGEVTAVSATVLTPQEVHAAIRLEEPVYRVVANLSRQSVDAYGRSMALQAGMALTADIILEERSLLEWLLEPLFAMRGRM